MTIFPMKYAHAHTNMKQKMKFTIEIVSEHDPMSEVRSSNGFFSFDIHSDSPILFVSFGAAS